MGPVWVRDAKAGKKGSLLRFHRLGLDLVDMVAAQQVKHAVDRQMRQMIRQTLALRRCLGGSDTVGQHQVTQMR